MKHDYTKQRQFITYAIKKSIINNNKIHNINRYKDYYNNKILQDQTLLNSITNINNYTQISNIYLNMSTKTIFNKPNILINIYYILYILTGVKPELIRSKRSIAAFKLRKNMLMGLKSKLSNKNTIFNFLDRFTTFILPKKKVTFKIKDYSSSVSLDSLNYFSELDYELEKGLGNQNLGIDINVVLNKNNTNKNIHALKYLNISISKS
jgi:large subunit ribosomal protein L5